MNWADEPATWKQLKQLREMGYRPTHPLTKNEAVELLNSCTPAGQSTPTAVMEMEPPAPGAFGLRTAVANARQAAAQIPGDKSAQCELENALTERQLFWVDTCRGMNHHSSGPAQVMDLYRKHGCLFCDPTTRQVQEILDALDSALPFWDRDHPALFFDTLALNFPELVRHH